MYLLDHCFIVLFFQYSYWFSVLKHLYFSSLRQCCFVELTKRESDRCGSSLLCTSHSQRLVLAVFNNDCMNVFILDNHEYISVVTVALNQILQQPIMVCQCQRNFFGVSNRCSLQVTGSVCN